MSYVSPFHQFVETNAAYNKWSGSLRAAQLPVQDAPSIYVVDLAFLMATFFDWGMLGVKGLSRFRKNERWDVEIAVINMAIALSNCLSSADNPEALPRENRNYLLTTFNGFVPELGSFAVSNSDLSGDPSRFFLRASTQITECVRRCGLRLTESNPVAVTAAIAANLSGAVGAVKRLFLYVSPAPPDDLLGPLRGSPRLTSSVQESPSLIGTGQALPPPVVSGTSSFQPPNPIPPQPENTSSGTTPFLSVFDQLDGVTDKQRTVVAESEFARWHEYGLEVARLQRIPERFVRGLLPSFEDADHSIYRLSDLEELLEQLMPGRRQWLVAEGVRRADFDLYWSAPRWVSEYIVMLTRRNFELEVQSKVAAGTEMRQALAEAMFFIPLYALAPADDGDNSLHLPVELFERARRHLAAVDDDQYCDYMVKNGLKSATDYVRAKISQGVL